MGDCQYQKLKPEPVILSEPGSGREPKDITSIFVSHLRCHTQPSEGSALKILNPRPARHPEAQRGIRGCFYFHGLGCRRSPCMTAVASFPSPSGDAKSPEHLSRNVRTPYPECPSDKPVRTSPSGPKIPENQRFYEGRQHLNFTTADPSPTAPKTVQKQVHFSVTYAPQPATCNLRPATCHLPPATCHLQPAT
jgi:hypothetical protein